MQINPAPLLAGLGPIAHFGWIAPAQIAAFAREIMPDLGGVGIYSTFCHVDARELKSDWNG